MSANSEYRYRLWGINWFPLLCLSASTLSLWVFLKYYDSSRPDELLSLNWKVPVHIIGWLILWNLIKHGQFVLRYLFYLAWALTVLWEVGQSVYFHDGFRFILSLALGVLFYSSYQWIEDCLELASVNPRLNWYNGKLTSIPHVQATVSLGEEAPVPVYLRAIDHTSAFILFEGMGDVLPQLVTSQLSLRLSLKYKTKEVEVVGKPVAELHWEQRGLGLQFSFEDLYHQSKYTNLVQQIKGEGLA